MATTTEWHCPVHECPYRYRPAETDEVRLLSFMRLVGPGDLGEVVRQAAILEAEQAEVVLREHFRAHTLEDFLRTIRTQATQIGNQGKVMTELREMIRRLELNVEMLARARSDG